LRVCNPSVRAVADELERDEIERWSSSLPQARVTRWGGMISTPDEYLQVCNVYYYCELIIIIGIQSCFIF